MNAPFAPRRAKTALCAVHPVELEDLAAAGLTAVAWKTEPKTCASPARTFAIAATPGVLRPRSPAAIGSGVEIVLRGDRVAAEPEIVDRAAEALRDPGGDHRDEGHEREADHQRRRGGRGPLRVPPRVVAGERAGRAAELRRRRTERPRERAGDPRPTRSATPMKIRSVPTPMKSRICFVPRPLPEKAVEERREAGQRQQRGAERPAPREARPAAAPRPRARRRSAARASRGTLGGGSRQRDEDRRRSARRSRSACARTIPLFGSVKPTASKSLKSPTPSPSPTKIPTTEASVPSRATRRRSRPAPGGATRRACAASRARASAARS